MRRMRSGWRGRLCALLLLIFTAFIGWAEETYAAQPKGVYSVELTTSAVGSVFELTGRRGLSLIRRSAVADENGLVRFDALPTGNYHLTGNPVTIDRVTYMPGEAEFQLPAFDPVTGRELSLLTITGKCSETQKEGPSAPPSRDLPKTGVTWWIVPVLSGIGFLFVAIGLIRRSRSRKEQPSAET